ncbi:unnamed protein product [Durusdinium trenchii]|uniref:Uncharacterized protein n=1 Tax=Durusdinium trenchii TaxID=1381693 RepID=A0ABP0H7Q5_9DINO
MPLHGLPEVARGAVVVSSAFSVLVSTAGLALLRGTRPSEVERLQRYADAGSPIQQWILWHVLGVFGALLLYIGLVLSSIPMLMGVSADDEGKTAAIVQQTLVLVCWLTERYLVEGRPLPLMQSCLCALIWFGSTVVEWAGPRPYDNMSLGLPGQIAGCDGGYRSPFLIYASVWLTGLTFGTLLLFCEEGTTLVSCVDPSDDEAAAAPDPAQEKTRRLQPFRRKVLPIVYAMATSMSGIVFATGTAGNDMRYITAGAVLLVIAVLCAWDFLWRLELPLSTWGAVFQGFTTSLRVVQSHFVFRDFRWDPEDMHGILIVYKFPGLQFFMTGMFVLFVSLQLYMYTCSWPEWSAGEQAQTSLHLSSLSRDTRAESLDEGSSFSHGRLCRFKSNHTPGYGHRFTDGDAYIDVITWLYDSRLPCSAFVVSYNAMILPPVQFLLFFFILLRPSFIPEELYCSMQAYVMNLAPMRFTQPCIMMLIVGIANMPGPGDTLFGGWFTHGYWYFIAYCTSAILLAWSVQPSEEDTGKYAAADDSFPCESVCEKGISSVPATGNGNSNGVHKDGDSARALMAKYKQNTGNNGDEDSDELSEASDGGDVCAKKPFEVAACVMGGGVVVATAYLALTQTYLNIEYRLSGLAIHGINPSVIDLWFSIGSVSRFLMLFAMTTMVLLPGLWLTLFAIRMINDSVNEKSDFVRWARYLEPIVRPWVLCHIWSASLCLVYYMVTARNKATTEVCATFPETPTGIVAILCLGVGMYGLIAYAKAVTRPKHLPKYSSVPQLPGGFFIWGLGPMACMAFWASLLYSHGPVRPPTLSTVDDVNSALSKLLPDVNRQLHKNIKDSAGDCEALWDYRTLKGEVLFSSPLSEIHRSCQGDAPLAHMSSDRGAVGTDITVLWATGLRSMEIADMVVTPPADMSAPVQPWFITLSAMFTDLHVYMKVIVNGKEWLKDYMCCDKTLHFTLKVSAECHVGFGFSALHLELLNMDKVNFVQKTQMILDSGASASFEMDYGTSATVEKAIANFLTLKTGNLLMRNSDGSTTDTLQTAGEALSHVIQLNTGKRCLSHV